MGFLGLLNGRLSFQAPPHHAPPESPVQELASSSTFAEVPKVQKAKKRPYSDRSPAWEATKELWPGEFILYVPVAGAKGYR